MWQVGPVSLIVYMKWTEAGLRNALKLEEDERAFTKRIEEFNKHVLPLARHKRAFNVSNVNLATRKMNNF